MERLTKTYSDGTHGAADNLPCGENSYTYKALLLEALGKYEDAEEQGLLFRLPCSIGTEVFEIEKQFWIDRKGCKDCLYFGNDGLGDYCDYDEDNYPACTKIVSKNFNMRMLENFGKNVFLTQEEAEQKLK